MEHSVFVCGGQGAQLSGLGSALLAAHPFLGKRVRTWSAVVGKDMASLLCGKVAAEDTFSQHLALVAYALLVHEQASGGEKTLSPSPFTFVAGHSLGEISALACAGALSAEDALRLAASRGEALSRACSRRPGAMLALIGEDSERMESLVHDVLADLACSDVWIANYNSPRQIVLSGGKESLMRCRQPLERAGVRVVPLVTAGAFHSPFMAEAADEVYSFASGLDWRMPREVCLSSMTNQVLTASSYAAHCALQVLSPVKWIAVMETMRRAGISRVITAGPPGMLTGLFRDVPNWSVKLGSVV